MAPRLRTRQRRRTSTLAHTLGSRTTPLPLETIACPASNCGFTSTTRSAPRLGQAEQRLSHHHQGNKRQIGDHHVEAAAPHVAGLQVAYVGVLHDLNPRVGPQPGQQLPVPDVHCYYLGDPALQETVGKTPRRSAGIQRVLPGHVQAKVLESGVKFFPAPAGKPRWQPAHHDRLGRGNLARRLEGDRPRRRAPAQPPPANWPGPCLLLGRG